MPVSAVIIEACAECRQDLEHCHGTAILHVDGAADCSDEPDCRLDAELHRFVISCAEVECYCDGAGEVPVLAAEQAAAS
jgi:hypothetical protein